MTERIPVYYFSISNKRNAHLPLYANKETGYISAIKDILPKDPELWDEDVNAALNEFMRLFLTKVCLHNFEDLLSTTYPARVKRKIEDVQKKKSTVAEKHVEGKRKIIQKLRCIYVKELERVFQINRLYKIPPTLTELKTSHTLQSGEEDNKFYFVIAINKEHPVEYALRKIYNSVDKRSLTRDSCPPAELFTKYAFDQAFSEKLNGQMTLQSLQQSIDTELVRCIISKPLSVSKENLTITSSVDGFDCEEFLDILIEVNDEFKDELQQFYSNIQKEIKTYYDDDELARAIIARISPDPTASPESPVTE